MQPYYDHKGITIYHGDCREVVPMIDLTHIDLTLTDIPYGEVSRPSSGLRKLDKGLGDKTTVPINEVVPVLLGAGLSYYVWCGTKQSSQLVIDFANAGLSTRVCVWEKTNPSPMNGEYLWLSALELCVFARSPKAYFSEFCASPVWRGKIDTKQWHPTQKPEWLMQRLITASCPSGGTILDPFMGSGTTLRAAKDLNRKAIGIEIEERYCEIAVERLRQEVLFAT